MVIASGTSRPCRALPLLVRISLSDIRRAVAARLFKRNSLGPAAETVRFADLELCRRTRLVRRGDQPIELTPMEFDLL